MTVFVFMLWSSIAILANCIPIRIVWKVSRYIDASMNRADTSRSMLISQIIHMSNKSNLSEMACCGKKTVLSSHLQSGIVCDKRMLIGLTMAVYKTSIRPVPMYGSENWALRMAEQDWLERTEMRMLRWMMWIKRIEKIGKEEIRARAGVANMGKAIREPRLRWLGMWREWLKKM